MKKLKNLIDTKQLSKKEQQKVKGGGRGETCYVECSPEDLCSGFRCYRNLN